MSRKAAALLVFLYAAAAAMVLAPQFRFYRAKIQLSRCEQALLLTTRLDADQQRRLLPAVREALRSVEERLPFDVRPSYLLGTSALLLGETGEAIEELRRSLALEERPETDLNLSRAHADAGDADDAAQDALRAIWLSPALHRELPKSEGPLVVRRILELRRELRSGSAAAIPRLAPSDAAAGEHDR
ncbi:MAG: hypothetical protein ACRD16_03390 [Thermoanaerobaculia bacterium]